MATRFFTSYSRQDDNSKALALALCDELSQRYGYDVFVDVEMRIGTEWPAELRRRVRWCDEFVVLLSKRAVESVFVHEEVREAFFLHTFRITRRPRIHPVLVDFAGPLDSELSQKLNRFQRREWQSRIVSATQSRE